MLAKIRRMHIRDGLPIREIARQTGLSRNTIRHWLRQPAMQEPRYPARQVISILDPWAEQLRQWLETDRHRNKRERRTAVHLYQALQAQGYPGGLWPRLRFHPALEGRNRCQPQAFCLCSAQLCLGRSLPVRLEL